MAQTIPDLQNLCRRPFILKENRVWRTYSGGKMLAQWRGRSEQDGARPEDWVGSTTRAVNAAHPGAQDEGLSRIDGKAAGLPDDPLLLDLIRHNPTAMLGEEHAAHFGKQMALLVKVLDAAERLAIQAHPDRTHARRFFHSSFGKTEAWYVLGVRADVVQAPGVLLGFREDMSEARWRRLFAEQDVQGMQQALHRIEVQPGDVLLIEGGVPHAIGEGCLMLELQEPTDYTLRVERTTTRGIALPDEACHQGVGFDAMLSMFRYNFLSREETLARWRIRPHPLREDDAHKLESLISQVQTPCFSLLRLRVRIKAALPCCESFQIAVVSEGKGVLSVDGVTIPLHRGDCLFLPALLEHAVLEARDLTVLLCRPPQLAPSNPSQGG